MLAGKAGFVEIKRVLYHILVSLSFTCKLKMNEPENTTDP